MLGHLSQTSRVHCLGREVHTLEFTTSAHEDPNVFFKNRTNPNKTLTPDCPLLTSHQAAKARVV